ncbi:MAG: heme NO-binding domain-containing protein [Myxococcota bacterium]
MKGIVYNLFEESVRRTHGEDAWDDILDRAGLDGVYTSLGTYPDEQLDRIVEAAAAVLHLPGHEVIRWFGQEAAGLLADRYPAFLERHTTTRTFLQSVDSVIHPEARKRHPNAEFPALSFEDLPDGRMSLIYLSHRQLCAFAHGLMEGFATRFGEIASVVHTTCRHRGDPQCTMLVGFERS